MRQNCIPLLLFLLVGNHDLTSVLISFINFPFKRKRGASFGFADFLVLVNDICYVASGSWTRYNSQTSLPDHCSAWRPVPNKLNHEQSWPLGEFRQLELFDVLNLGRLSESEDPFLGGYESFQVETRLEGSLLLSVVIMSIDFKHSQ